MRRLTFTGYLESYVHALAGGRTLALPKLVRMSQSEPRLVEPLLLWATVTDRAPRLRRLLEGREDLQQELDTLAGYHSRESLVTALDSESAQLRPEFSKVWRSYVVRRDAPSRDAQLKLQARERALMLESAKRVSRYRMAKDLSLNPGNLHAFLGQGNPSKLSLDRAMQLVQYLEAA